MDFQKIGPRSMEYLQHVAEAPTKFQELTIQYIQLLEQFNLQIPNFKTTFEWINTGKEKLSFKSNLKNKLCILDFFTYCCINCMHILPDLHALEEKFPIEDGLAIIGVHSAKFQNEKINTNILNAVLRYNINHAVVNDSQAEYWSNMCIQCWPTLVVVSPGGKVLLYLVGEGHKDTLVQFVQVALDYYKPKGLISNHSLPIHLAKDGLKKQTLKFPGKVSPNGNGKTLAISNSGNHQILLASNEGVILNYVGSGQGGFIDGAFEDCQFNSPQGLTWDGDDILYIADTENHAIRKVVISSQQVTTVAGTGRQGNDKEGGSLGILQEISSPWDVLIDTAPGSDISSSPDKACLYIAAAGTHQIWCYFLEDGSWLKKISQKATTCLRFAGSGNEENRNNSYPHKASFAQPSGLTAAIVKEQKYLYVADSESSSVRSIETKSGSVKSCVGGERDPTNLFAYGDVDGKGLSAKLQHPLSVAFDKNDGLLYVADSYNHKIKFIDPVSMICTTLCGTGEAGYADGTFAECQFNEPGDVKVVDKLLYVADTNNHCIRIVDLEKKEVRTISLLQRDETDATEITKTSDAINAIVNLKSAKIFSFPPILRDFGHGIKMIINISFGNGLKLNNDAESQIKISYVVEQTKKVKSIDRKLLKSLESSCSVESLVPAYAGGFLMKIELLLYLCSVDQACYMKQHVLEQPLIHDGSSIDLIQFNHTVSL